MLENLPNEIKRRIDRLNEYYRNDLDGMDLNDGINYRVEKQGDSVSFFYSIHYIFENPQLNANLEREIIAGASACGIRRTVHEK